MPAARFLVRGRVQGVGFRAAACAQARALGLAGLARNLDGGDVEVLATGPADAVEALARWLRHGPSPARVDGLSRREPTDVEVRSLSMGRFDIA